MLKFLWTVIKFLVFAYIAILAMIFVGGFMMNVMFL